MKEGFLEEAMSKLRHKDKKKVFRRRGGKRGQNVPGKDNSAWQRPRGEMSGESQNLKGGVIRGAHSKCVCMCEGRHFT